LDLQGYEVNFLVSQNKVATFQIKIQLCQRRVQSNHTSVFSPLTSHLVDKKADCTFTNDIIKHIKTMDETNKDYFPDLYQHEKM